MTYNPSIPNANDIPSSSQGQMLINFGQLNTQIGTEHVALNAGSDNGKHKYVTLKQNPSAPVPIGTDLVFQQGAVGGKWSVETEDSLSVFRHVPLRTLSTIAVNAGGPFDTSLVDFSAGFGSNCSGTILVYDVSQPSRLIFCPFVWNSPGLSIPSAQYGQIISGGYNVTHQLEYLFDAGSLLMLHHGAAWVAGNVRVIVTESRTV